MLEQFGSPFSCQIGQDGTRRGYLFNSTSQFNGFQYMSSNYTYCFNPKDPKSQNNCKCEYANIKLVYPLEIHCKPWYLSSNSSSYVSFSEPYIDYDSSKLISTSTFKVVNLGQNSNLQNQVTLEQNKNADAVFGLDFNLNELQQRQKQENNSTTEYSYIVLAATYNFDYFEGNYEYTAITHPHIRRCLKQNESGYMNTLSMRPSSIQLKKKSNQYQRYTCIYQLIYFEKIQEIDCRYVMYSLSQLNDTERGVQNTIRAFKYYSSNQLNRYFCLNLSAKEMNSDESIENLDKKIEKYVESSKIYFLVYPKIGQSLCMNNLGIIHQIKRDYPKALVYQQKANIISDEILQDFFKDLDNSQSLPKKQALLCTKFNLLMNSHACRKFQLAQLIIRNIFLGSQGQAFQQYYQSAFEEDKKELLHDFMVNFNQNQKNSIRIRKQPTLQKDYQDMLQKNEKFEKFRIKKCYDPQESIEALQNIQQIIKETNIKLSSFQLETLQSDIQNIQSAAQNYSEVGFFELFFKFEK
ncbi:hypothetical protein ABPG72_013427 [Tetrahymena utriculariae]